jgi:uncharacterized protein (DUF1800 family)
MDITPTPTTIAHLLRRAAFGATPAEIDAGVAAGIAATVDRLLDFSVSPPDRQPAGLPDPAAQIDGKAEWQTDLLRRWWLDRMITSTTPALEKLAFVWHGHFATSVNKVGSDVLMWRQNVTLRRYGAGSFRALVQVMSRDAALLLWLDANANEAGAPNENFARELMELFCLGRNNGYTQADVREAARALTGWFVDDHYDWDGTYRFRFEREHHDDGLKTLLGRTGRWRGDDAVDIIVDHPGCPEFITRHLWRRYAGTEAAPAVLADLAGPFARDLDVRALLRRIFTHPAFYEPSVLHGLVSSPTEFVVRAMRGFGIVTGDLPDVVDWTWSMGQSLFAPPNVGGWRDGRAWTGAAASAARVNFAFEFGRLVADRAARGGRGSAGLFGLVGQSSRLTVELLRRLGAVEISPRTEAAIARVLGSRGSAGDRLTGAVTLALLSPEVQLL